MSILIYTYVYLGVELEKFTGLKTMLGSFCKLEFVKAQASYLLSTHENTSLKACTLLCVRNASCISLNHYLSESLEVCELYKTGAVIRGDSTINHYSTSCDFNTLKKYVDTC